VTSLTNAVNCTVVYLSLSGQGPGHDISVDHAGHVTQLWPLMEPAWSYGRVDVDGVIQECIDLLCCRRDQVEVALDLGLDRPHCLDVEALRQVVVNIGLNAIQAMEKGEGRSLVVSREEHECMCCGLRILVQASQRRIVTHL